MTPTKPKTCPKVDLMNFKEVILLAILQTCASSTFLWYCLKFARWFSLLQSKLCKLCPFKIEFLQWHLIRAGLGF